MLHFIKDQLNRPVPLTLDYQSNNSLIFLSAIVFDNFNHLNTIEEYGMPDRSLDHTNTKIFITIVTCKTSSF